MLKRNPPTHQIAKRVDSLSQVPARLRPLYEACHDADYSTGIPFKLTTAGAVLRRVREQLANDDGAPVGGRTSHVSRSEFQLLVGCADPHERPEILRMASRGQIKVET